MHNVRTTKASSKNAVFRLFCFAKKAGNCHLKFFSGRDCVIQNPLTSPIRDTITLQRLRASGVRGGGLSPPRLEKFRANSVFRASSCFSKILKDRKYFNTVKNSVFQGKRRLFKILYDKKHIFNTVNSGHNLFFRASTSSSKS